MQYRLAPWGDDDLIEYLLAAYRDQCGSIVARLTTAGDVKLAAGNSELLRIALDLMAGDELIAGARHALARFLVDLRGAKFDSDQAQHFLRCRAILRALA